MKPGFGFDSGPILQPWFSFWETLFSGAFAVSFWDMYMTPRVFYGFLRSTVSTHELVRRNQQSPRIGKRGATCQLEA